MWIKQNVHETNTIDVIKCAFNCKNYKQNEKENS